MNLRRWERELRGVRFSKRRGLHENCRCLPAFHPRLRSPSQEAKTGNGCASRRAEVCAAPGAPCRRYSCDCRASICRRGPELRFSPPQGSAPQLRPLLAEEAGPRRGGRGCCGCLSPLVVGVIVFIKIPDHVHVAPGTIIEIQLKSASSHSSGTAAMAMFTATAAPRATRARRKASPPLRLCAQLEPDKTPRKH